MTPQEKEGLLALAGSVLFSAIVLFLRAWMGAYECEAVFIALLVYIAVLWSGRWIVGLRWKDLDERDRAIRYQAGLVASHMFGAAVMLGTIGLCWRNREVGAIPVVHVAYLAYFGWMSMYVVWSVTVLTLYRKGSSYGRA